MSVRFVESRLPVRRTLGFLVLALTLGCQKGADDATSKAASAPAGAKPAGKADAKADAKADTKAKPAEDLAKKADTLAHQFIILDGHVDVPYRLEGGKKDGAVTEDVSAATEDGDFDYPRAKKGGLDAPFMSIYIPAHHEEEKTAKKLADSLIDMVEGMIEKHPDKFGSAVTPADVRRNFEAGKISLPMGMENGAPIEGDLANIAHFRERGVRYITLTHSKDNHISDSSFDDRHTHKGLSEFGKKVVPEMNRQGIMVDVSHISDDAFWQVMDLTKVPVIASHSSCRHFIPGFERNMSDDMIKALAKNGGVIQINFGSGFISAEARKARSAMHDELKAFMEKNDIKEYMDPRVQKWRDEHKGDRPPVFATVEQVADHIDHVKKLVGVDHVGFGSDFDGVGDSLPTGLKDVSQYPNLIRVLLERGYTEADIEKVASGNVLRVWQAVDDYANKQARTGDAAKAG